MLMLWYLVQRSHIVFLCYKGVRLVRTVNIFQRPYRRFIVCKQTPLYSPVQAIDLCTSVYIVVLYWLVGRMRKKRHPKRQLTSPSPSSSENGTATKKHKTYKSTCTVQLMWKLYSDFWSERRNFYCQSQNAKHFTAPIDSVCLLVLQPCRIQRHQHQKWRSVTPLSPK